MNIYILDGKYTKYVCFADSLSEVQKQLEIRYGWGKEVKVNLIETSFSSNLLLHFIITWSEYSMNEYKNVQKEATFKVFPMGKYPNDNCLIPYRSDGYF